MNTVNFISSIKDTFPYIESTIIKLDNNYDWWKKNAIKLEDELSNEIRAIADSPITINTKLIIYNGKDDDVQAVRWSAPAIQFTFPEVSLDFMKKLKSKLGGNTWNGHNTFIEDNNLIVLFE